MPNIAETPYLSPAIQDAGLGTGLSALLAEWRCLYDHSLQSPHSDFWRFTERTHVGLLAAAAWRNGSAAFEEVAAQKFKAIAQRDGPGRCDLILHLDDIAFFVEAKRTRPMLGCSDDVDRFYDDKVKGLQVRLKSARDDACRTLRRRKGTRRMSVVFVMPRIPRVAVTEAREIRRNFLKELNDFTATTKHVDFCSAWFPTAALRPNRAASFLSSKGSLFFGVTILGRVHGLKPNSKK